MRTYFYVIALASLGLVAVALRSLNEFLPFGLFAAGVVGGLWGVKLNGNEKAAKAWSLGNSAVKPGTSWNFMIGGLLAVIASLTQVWLDGNSWLLIAPAIVAAFAGLCIQQYGASELDVIRWREVGQSIVAILLPTLGLIALRYRSETGAELGLALIPILGFTTMLGAFCMPRSFIRIGKLRYRSMVA